MPANKTRDWCFTINNYGLEAETKLRELVTSGSASYIVCGRERGESGTPHLQGFIRFPNARRFNSVRRIPVFVGSHLEPRKGPVPRAIEYCKKDGDWWEEGDAPNPRGHRSDLESVRSKLANGASLNEIANEHFNLYVQYRRSFEAYIDMQSKPRTWKTVVHVITGPTGVGKTRFVFEQCGDDPPWVHGGDRWFDGYVGQRVALFDDFRGELDFSFMLRLLDRYAMRVPIKGGFTNWCPTKVYITSNQLWQSWYNRPQSDLDALRRRLDVIVDATENLFE